MQFWDYFTHFQWAKAQPELRRELKAMDVGAFYEWYFGQMNARAMASTGRRLEEIDPFRPTVLQPLAEPAAGPVSAQDGG